MSKIMGSERIVAAAVRTANTIHGGDLIISQAPPARHHTILHPLHDMLGGRNGRPSDTGFLTSTGRYVNRSEALVIATAAGQRIPRQPGQYDGPDLFSEDLW